LEPLHKTIQEVLRSLEQDATFDQVGKLEQMIEKVAKKNIKSAYSFDLSSATDRLPILLQVGVLSRLLGSRPATAWANILITRLYRISRFHIEKYNLNPEKDSRLAYKTGQPMGALSSWVMLALTHHIVVQ